MKNIRNKILIICCSFGIGCQNNTKQIYIEDYIKTADYDNISIVDSSAFSAE